MSAPGGSDAQAQRIRATQERYMRIVEEENIKRVAKLKKIRRNNAITGSLLGAFALSIYAYSMHAIKQESFLDDFNPPEKISD